MSSGKLGVLIIFNCNGEYMDARSHGYYTSIGYFASWCLEITKSSIKDSKVLRMDLVKMTINVSET